MSFFLQHFLHFIRSWNEFICVLICLLLRKRFRNNKVSIPIFLDSTFFLPQIKLLSQHFHAGIPRGSFGCLAFFAFFRYQATISDCNDLKLIADYVWRSIFCFEGLDLICQMENPGNVRCWSSKWKSNQ